jgi:hypothetical protein
MVYTFGVQWPLNHQGVLDVIKDYILYDNFGASVARPPSWQAY